MRYQQRLNCFIWRRQYWRFVLMLALFYQEFRTAAHNGPLNDMQSKTKVLLLGLKVLLKEYCPAAFRIGVLVRDCNRAGTDPGSGKNALAVL